MQISEIAITVGKNGSLLIPSDVLKEMGLGPNSLIHIAYLTRSGEENTFQELFLSPDGIERIQEDAAIQLPNMLLEQAGLTDGGDLKILCLNGCILICRDALLNTEDLREISGQLERAEELASALPFGTQEVQSQLADFISHFEEGSEG